MEENLEKYMHRCLQLAKLGEGHTSPNPLVGCVIVCDGIIIGEGFHQQYGGHHAEVNAINNVTNKLLLNQSTLFVNLEPCSHYGKTPPCADLIIENEIPRVVIGTIDPNIEVAGAGIEKLRKAGCNIIVGILEPECRELNRRFFNFHLKKRPYIILKWAQTIDGFVDTDRAAKDNGKAIWITDEIARVAVHKQRSTEGAIFIGTETALKDNPSLTLREWFGQQPLRIVADLFGRLPSDLKLYIDSSKTVTISKANLNSANSKIFINPKENNVIQTLLEYLYLEKIQSVIIEGGPKTLQHFIDEDLWEEAHVYKGYKIFEKGVMAPVFNFLNPDFTEYFLKSELSIFRKSDN